MELLALKGRVIDALAEEPIENGLVIVRDRFIDYVGLASGYSIPAEAKIIEIENGTIMPGFIDCHTHLIGQFSLNDNSYKLPHFDLLLSSAYEIGNFLDAGFTSVRDMSLFGPYLKKAVSKGFVRGPRIMPGARILSVTGGHGDLDTDFDIDYCQKQSPITYLVDGVEDCIKGTRLQFREGAEFIKVTATGGVSSPGDQWNEVQFSFSELKAIVDEAERHGTYVAAHCMGAVGTYQALKAGVKSIEHGVELDDACIDLMIKNDVTLVATLTISLKVSSAVGRYPEWMEEKAKLATKSHIKSIIKAKEAGVRVAFGSDYVNSPKGAYGENAEEFSSLVNEIGYTPMESIKIGTINSAHLMKMEDKIGSLEMGKYADIVVVEGNPIDDITLLNDRDNVKLVLKEGKVQKDITKLAKKNEYYEV